MKRLLIWILFSVLFFQSCKKDTLSEITNKNSFPKYLSSYKIYQGDLINLIPNNDYIEYKLSSALFTDYAEKQRLIKIPTGTQITDNNNGLPSFPDGTIIVKTFYYYHDKSDTLKGKKVIETRLLVKESGKWNVADYLWNSSQTDGILIEDGINTTVNFIDKSGSSKVIAYHVPSNRECVTCHSSNNEITPIGPKLKNMNFDVQINGNKINQLNHFQNLNLFNLFDHNSLLSMPNYKDENIELEKRARAYLDINCAHCHNSYGFAQDQNLYLNYELPFLETNIDDNKRAIESRMENGSMPHIGTTVLDDKGIELIKEYINSLE